ncbi:hypothetical protein AB0395_22225 [Streptosporangium sp. NPDC051023]|uniref:hypothetical protein n=1 Tax=Streptosporangium sp. NPDC051023 TaxID=3155410 RepID=UPI003450A8D3
MTTPDGSGSPRRARRSGKDMILLRIFGVTAASLLAAMTFVYVNASGQTWFAIPGLSLAVLFLITPTRR